MENDLDILTAEVADPDVGAPIRCGNQFQCNVCGTICHTRQAYLNHMSTHKSELPCFNKICGSKSTWMKLIEAIIVKRTKEEELANWEADLKRRERVNFIFMKDIPVGITNAFVVKLGAVTLSFTWPHVSRMSGFRASGSRAVLISYKDQSAQIQKFALRFAALCDVEAFMATLKELMEFPKDFGNKSQEQPVSRVSSQSDFVPSEEVAYRGLVDWNTEINTYKNIEQLESSFNGEVVAQKSNLPQRTSLNYNVGNISRGLPSSSMIGQVNVEEVKPTLSEQADIKLQLMRYLDDSSLQDIMGKVDEVMSKTGNGMLMI